MIHHLKEFIFDLFDGPTLSELATINSEGRPRVRYVMSTIDRDMILRIPTERATRKVREIREHPDVHLLVGKDLFSSRGAYAQFEGYAIVTSDQRMKREMWDRSMEHYVRGPADPNYVLIEIRPYRIEYWSALEQKNPAVLESEDLEPVVVSEAGEYWSEEDRNAPVFAI